MRPYACYAESETSSFLLPLLVDPLPVDLGLAAGLQDARSPDGYPNALFLGNQNSLPSTLTKLKDFLRSQRIVTCFIRSHPLQGVSPEHFVGIGEVVRRGDTVPIYLDVPYEQIQQGMRRDHRRLIRTAPRLGYRTVFDDWSLLPEFVRLYRDLMEKVEAQSTYRYSDDYFAEFRSAVGESAHLAFVISPHGAPAAGAIFTLCSGIVQYHLAVSDSSFRKHAPQKLVIDALIRWGIQHGARVLHLGGGVGARDDSLLDFKSGFGRTRTPYYTIHVTPRPEAAREAADSHVRRVGAIGLESNFFPAHRAPGRTGT